jgi:putative tryptophan/tyrosine transport system substrate-binding protein
VIDRRAFISGLTVGLLARPHVAEAQQARVYRVGVVLHGGQYFSAIDGLRDGLRELGLEEGKQFVLLVRDGKGDLKQVEAAARSLEREKVDLIYAVTTSVTLAAKRAMKSVPIVFVAGTDPVSVGLVESFRKPGGRLTGIANQGTGLTAKRLELLKEMVPRLRRVVTFYSPDNPASQQAVKIARDAGRRLKVELVERPVASIEELRAGLRALRPEEADAFFYVADAMVGSQTELIIESAGAKRLPTMFQERESVARGALAAYGESLYTIGRLSAKHVQRVLLGADPGDLPVEQVDRFHFVINLKTAKALGLTIPPSLLQRADQVIE